MASAKPRQLLMIEYEEAAEAYFRSLPLEHFMEATSQATQRQITVDSLTLVQDDRPDMYVFSELLVQYPWGRQRKLRQVVPDNMVVISDAPIKAKTNYALPLEPARPYWMLDYVSKNTKRKDYDDNFLRYERELKTPYYLVFYPDNEDLTLFHLSGKKYRAVRPNERDRYAIPQLNLEMGLLEGWVRFWHHGELLQLPAALKREAVRQTRRADLAEQRLFEEQRVREALERELERLRGRNGSAGRTTPPNG